MKLISYDFGTGGVKASLYDEALRTLAKDFVEYETGYPFANWHEQNPDDWWSSMVKTTKNLLEKSGVAGHEVAALATSGASLVSVPIDKDGRLLLNRAPIWSDTRAEQEAKEFFRHIGEQEWYLATGNGFPAPCYPIFKLMWMKKHQADIFERTAVVLGTKDYINFLITGNILTDRSYASGTGAYDLHQEKMREDFLSAAGLPAKIFPKVVPSHHRVGSVTANAAKQLGLSEGTAVICGGVDNACMALGAVGTVPGKAYVSLGSSSWIPVNSTEPVLDVENRPYVFAHAQEGLFTSAFSIFSGGSSLRWVRETLCRELSGEKVYAEMDQIAQESPAGANGVLFNPSLAGGTSQDKSIYIRGGYLGLRLGTQRGDLIRSTMEGVALNLKLSLDTLRKKTEIDDKLLVCGGGSKSRFWMQIFADVFGMSVYKTNVDQDAASLGAAAIAARGLGLWPDYSRIPALHVVEYQLAPDPQNTAAYAKLLPVFQDFCQSAAVIGEQLHRLGM